jgi:APA family basic amino acid/polyamine antiporter
MRVTRCTFFRPSAEHAVPASNGSQQLIRGLGALDATSLVVGTVIGTGIFLKTALITQLVGTPALALGAWAVAGLLSLAGALTYAELGAMMPATGGEYVFLRTAYGDAVAFNFGWMRVVVGASSTAAVAASCAAFVTSLVPLDPAWIVVNRPVFGHLVHWQFGGPQVVAVAALAIVGAVNSAGIIAGARTQNTLALFKVTAILLIIGGVFALSKGATWAHFHTGPGASGPSMAGVAVLPAFGAAVVNALWAYTGWSYLPMVAGEMRNPGRTLPRAIIGGILVVMALYLTINVAYFYALPVSDIVTANSTRFPAAPAVAARAVGTFLSGTGAKLLIVVFALSALGTVNGAMMTGPRVPFAMARDGQFFNVFGTLGRRSHAPVVAILTNATIAAILAASGTYDQLTNLVIFAYAIFYVLAGASLFVLRRRDPDRPRPYRTWGYPVVPLIFVVAMGSLTLNMLWTNPLEAWVTIALLAPGIPAYLYFRRQRRRIPATG